MGDGCETKQLPGVPKHGQGNAIGTLDDAKVGQRGAHEHDAHVPSAQLQGVRFLKKGHLHHRVTGRRVTGAEPRVRAVTLAVLGPFWASWHQRPVA